MKINFKHQNVVLRFTAITKDGTVDLNTLGDSKEEAREKVTAINEADPDMFQEWERDEKGDPEIRAIMIHLFPKL